jgi:hypothetical protein
VRFDLIDKGCALFGCQDCVQLVQGVGRRIVQASSHARHLGERNVDLGCIDGPGFDAISQRSHHLLLGGAGGLHLREEIRLNLLDDRVFVGRGPERVEAHGDEHRHATVVVMPVMLGHVRRGLVVRRSRRRCDGWRRRVRRACARPQGDSGSRQAPERKPHGPSNRSHLNPPHARSMFRLRGQFTPCRRGP